MDFNEDMMSAKHHGFYENLEIDSLPPLWLAYLSDPSDSGSQLFVNKFSKIS